MKQRNNVVSLGVEYTPHDQQKIIPRERSSVFYHPLWALGILLLLFVSGIGAYFY